MQMFGLEIVLLFACFLVFGEFFRSRMFFQSSFQISVWELRSFSKRSDTGARFKSDPLLLLNPLLFLWQYQKFVIREFKKLRRQLKGKRHIKIELCVKLRLFRLFMLITLYKMGGVHFRLLGTHVFYVKAKYERFTAASFRCRQNLKYKNFTSSFGRLRQN